MSYKPTGRNKLQTYRWKWATNLQVEIRLIAWVSTGLQDHDVIVIALGTTVVGVMASVAFIFYWWADQPITELNFQKHQTHLYTGKNTKIQNLSADQESVIAN